jgi:hypothetical protein
MAAAGPGEPAEMITLLRAIFVSSVFLSWMWDVAIAGQPQTMPLWPNGAPGSEGRLGFGLRSSNSSPVAAWPRRFLEWLQARGIISRMAD